MSNKPRFVGEKVRLGELISKSKKIRCGTRVLPVLSATKNNGIVLQSDRFKKQIASKDQSDYLVVSRGQLVMTMHLDQGVLGVQDVVEEGIVSPAYKVWDINSDRVRSAYLELALKSPKAVSYFLECGLSTVAGRCNVPDKTLLRLEIPLPPFREQDEAVSSFGCITNLISEAQSQIDELDQLVKSRFVEMFGDLKINKNGWPVEVFDSFAVIDTHMTNDLASFANKPHIGIDSIESGSGRLSGYRTVAEDGIISGKYPFTSDHIIYSKIRPALNKVALPDFDGVCSADAYPILPIEGRCNRIYLAQVMRSTFFLDYVLPLSGRAQMPKVNKKALQGFSMPVPPIKLQDSFAAFVALVDKPRFIAQRQIEKLQILYDSLAQDYFC